MADREKLGPGLIADPSGRRIGRDQRWILGLQGLEFTHQTVIFGVRNHRIIENIITAIMVANQ
jgi:hypothetical protein